MTPPIDPKALRRVLETLPPEKENPFQHLENLTPDQLLQKRVEITGQLKTLEQERQAIDAELLEVFSDPELRHGIRFPGGWVLKQRSRTTWDYPTNIKEQIRSIQTCAQTSGQATQLHTTYLVLTQEGS